MNIIAKVKQFNKIRRFWSIAIAFERKAGRDFYKAQSFRFKKSIQK